MTWFRVASFVLGVLACGCFRSTSSESEVDAPEDAGPPRFCRADSCSNGGLCIEEADGFRCECPMGFEGTTCQCTRGRADEGVDVSMLENPAIPSGVWLGKLFDPSASTLVLFTSTEVSITDGSGFGVVGAPDDSRIDDGEFIDLTISPGTRGFAHSVVEARDDDRDGRVGERTVEAFVSMDGSLGVTRLHGSGATGVDARSDPSWSPKIIRVRITADGDSFRLGSMTIGPLVCP